jgi:hypothetical protein
MFKYLSSIIIPSIIPSIKILPSIEILSNDRIIVINEWKLPYIHNCRHDRRNIVCTSEIFKTIIEKELGHNLNPLQKDIQVLNLLSNYRDELTDMKVIKVAGF